MSVKNMEILKSAVAAVISLLSRPVKFAKAPGLRKCETASPIKLAIIVVRI